MRSVRHASGAVGGVCHAFVLPEHAAFANVDRVHPVENLHPLVGPFIAAFDDDQRPTPAHTFGIGLGIIMWHTKVYERVDEIAIIIRVSGRVGRILGVTIPGIVRHETYITAGKPIVDQILPYLLGVAEAVI
jgi:hypothetical protein